MDSRSRPLPEPLTDLPVEAPVDALIPSEPRSGKRGHAASGPKAPRSGKGASEELVDPEKLLLASEQAAAEPPRTGPAPPGPPATPGPLTAPAAPPVLPEAARAAPTVLPEPARAIPTVPPAVASAPRQPTTAAASPPGPIATPAAPTPAAPTPAAPTPAAPTPAAPTPAAAPTPGPALMDRDFIARNQVVERYLSGRLPIKGATDFERFCREHPELLDELGIPERVNAALRLLEASGKPEPWAEAPKPSWQRLEIVLGLLGAVLVLGAALAIVASGSAHKTRAIAALQQEAMERPLDPATSTRDIRLLPSRDGASDTPAIVIGGGSEAELADFRIDESRSPYRLFRITIDRINQGRVGVIDHLAKDSDGNLRIALNSTALGPGDYQLTIEGLNWQGRPQPDSWVTIGVRPSSQ